MSKVSRTKMEAGLGLWGPRVCGAVVSLKQRNRVHQISWWPQGHLSVQSALHPNLLCRPETKPAVSHRRGEARFGLSVGKGIPRFCCRD